LKANVISLAIIFVGLFVFASNAAALPWTPWRIAGIAIALPAFVVLIISRIELGRAFSVRAKASVLVTSGIYSRIRNPIYVFSTILMLALIIWTGRPWLLLFLVVLVPMQVYRSKKEQAVLAEKFGDEYLAYKRQTWF
jgi:protein-S-isoprenylcysteine O-methyltransferase Ste14